MKAGRLHWCSRWHSHWIAVLLASALGAFATSAGAVIPEPIPEQTVERNWPLIPKDGEGNNLFSPGEKFRLMFVTSASFNIHGPDTALTHFGRLGTNHPFTFAGFYNAQVQAYAGLLNETGHSAIRKFARHFRAFASFYRLAPDGEYPSSFGAEAGLQKWKVIEHVDARDNTETTHTASDRGVPVYWLNGKNIANDYRDLYSYVSDQYSHYNNMNCGRETDNRDNFDGVRNSWNSYEARNQNGGGIGGGHRGVWTGSWPDGTAIRNLGKVTRCYVAGQDSDDVSNGMGGFDVMTGVLSDGGGAWGGSELYSGQTAPAFGPSRNAFNRLYGLSPVIKINANVVQNIRLSDQTAPQGAEFTYTIPLNVFTDLEGDDLTYSSEGMPGWLSFDPITRTFRGTPTAADIGSTTITVSVMEAGNPESISDSFLLTVAARSIYSTAPAAPESQLVPTDWPLAPTDLISGDSFRLLFITSGARDAHSLNPADYNRFAQGEAGGHESIREFADQFRALISTEFVDARDNTATTGTGVPIYWQRGAKVANNYADFYNGDWASQAGKNLHGNNFTPPRIWTGSRSNGTENSGHSASDYNARVRTGVLVAGKELHDPDGLSASTDSLPLYVLSPVITLNARPVLNRAIPRHEVVTGSPFTYTFSENTFTDPDGDRLTYSYESEPKWDWLQFDPATRTFSGTPDTASLGNTRITVIARDAGHSVTTTFNLFVRAASDSDTSPPPQEQLVPADWALKPEGVGPGGSFRLLYVTISSRNGRSSSITDYNLFVQGKIDSLNTANHEALRPFRREMRMLISTEHTDARDNTATTGEGVPIYWVNRIDAAGDKVAGEKVADNYGDFYDGDWDSQAGRYLGGSPVGSGVRILTGSASDGTAASGPRSGYVAGGARGGRFGRLISGQEMYASSSSNSNRYNFYVMTPVLTLMEVPNTDLLDLTLSDGAQLTPTFARDQYEYQANVGNLTDSVTVTASAAYPEDTVISVNNQIVVSGMPSLPITLTENASTTIDIIVQRSEVTTGEVTTGEVTTGEYQVIVFRFAAPVFDETVIDPQNWHGGVEIRALQLPQASGGLGSLSYRLEPAVAGLTFDPGSRLLSGVPTDTAASTPVLTYTVTDSSGTSSHLSFVAALNAPPVPPQGQLVPADSFLRPEGVGPGGSFRLLYVTRNPRNGRSSSITDYNLFVQGQIGSGGGANSTDTKNRDALRPFKRHLRALISTEYTDARDNTDTTGVGVPIYWVNRLGVKPNTVVAGGKVADDYGDFYDGNWNSQAGRYLRGSSVGSTKQILTGSTSDGIKDPSGYAGGLRGRHGLLKSGKEMYAGLSANSNRYNFYVMTPVLTLMEVPNTDLLDLTLSDGAQLTPNFARDQHAYQVEVGNLTDSVTVTASAAYPDAVVSVNTQTVASGAPSQTIALAENASTTIDISVQLSGVTTGAYRVNVFRFAAPDFDEAGPISQNWHGGLAIAALQLPQASGGLGSLSYRLEPAVAGLTFDPVTRLLSGTPTDTAASTPVLTYTVTDSSGASSHLSFAATINALVAPDAQSLEPGWALKPAGVSAGAPFRLLFVTAPVSATSAYMLTYNSLVQAQADGGHSDIRGFKDEFRALISTEAVDARDNTDTNTATTGEGVPVYWLGVGGDKVADNYTGLYSGSWVSRAGRSGDGTLLSNPGTARIWTGSDRNGVGDDNGLSGNQAGKANVRVGHLHTSGQEIYGSVDARTETNLLYALSPVLTVRPGNDAELHSLSLSAGALTPAFARATTAYSTLLANRVDSLTVTTTTADNVSVVLMLNGVVVNNPNNPIVLAVGGNNVISLVVTAEDGVTTRTYTLTVSHSDLSFGEAVIAPQVWTAGAVPVVAAGVFPTATRGSGALSYSMTNLPAGVSYGYDGVTSTFSGAASAQATLTYTPTYKVTDANGIDALISFSIIVNPAPGFDVAARIAEQMWTVGETPIPPVFPTATDGSGALSYQLVNLPPGVTYNNDTFTFSGAAGDADSVTVTYTVTDANGAVGRLEFVVTVNPVPYFEETDAIGAQVWTVGVRPALPVGGFPVASGGSAPLSYSVTGLPAGVTYDGAAFIGVATAMDEVTATYTVADVNGATGSLTFEVTVNSALSFSDAVIAPQEWTAGVTPALPAATLALPAGGFPTATGGNGVLSYSITDLPAGVTYDGAAFSGAAIEASATPYNASYTVTDADGSTATLSFAVTVSAAPTFGTFVIAPQSWTVGIEPTLPPGGFPRATGGSGVLSYQMAGLPAG